LAELHVIIDIAGAAAAASAHQMPVIAAVKPIADRNRDGMNRMKHLLGTGDGDGSKRYSTESVVPGRGGICLLTVQVSSRDVHRPSGEDVICIQIEIRCIQIFLAGRLD
jgi:hypothetical protein